MSALTQSSRPVRIPLRKREWRAEDLDFRLRARRTRLWAFDARALPLARDRCQDTGLAVRPLTEHGL